MVSEDFAADDSADAHPGVSDSRILIVDDEADNAELLKVTLNQWGYHHITTTSDPREVLPLYRSQQPDLILLDLRMPQLDGYEVMAQLHEAVPVGDYLPILVLTADISPQARRRAL